MNTISAMQKAIDFIEKNLKDEITSEMISKEVCMSAFHFQRLFSIFFGISLGEYIRNRRLSLAAEEIRLTEKKSLILLFSMVMKVRRVFPGHSTDIMGLPLQRRATGRVIWNHSLRYP